MLAIEAIQDESADEAADCRRHTIRGDERRELRWRDMEHVHQLRAQRHHDHEIEDVRELHSSEREKCGALAPWRERMMLCRVRHETASVGVFGQSATITTP